MRLFPEPPRISEQTPPWGRTTALAAMLLTYLVVPLISTALLAIFWPTLADRARFLLQQILPIGAWGIILLSLAAIYKTDLRPALGLQLDRPAGYYLRESLLAILGVVLIFTALSLILSLLFQSPEELADPYRALTPDRLLMVTLLGLFSAPIVEEIIFRGFLQSTLYKYYSPGTAVILTALIFGLFHSLYHTAPVALISVYLLGLLFSYFRLRTGSIIPSIAAHLFNNIMAAIPIFMRLQGG